jgi:CheY-like chemotaxis protein
MPAQIAVVHDDAAFQAAAVVALRAEGYSVAAYEDALSAMVDLKSVQQLDLLVTRFQFAPGRSNGVALVMMARRQRPHVKVIFTAPPDMEEHASGLGRFLAMPVAIPDLIKAVREELS